MPSPKQDRIWQLSAVTALVSLLSLPVSGAQTNVWTIASNATLEIGRESGSPEYIFASIVATRRLVDGRILVADSRDVSIRSYSPQGVFLRRIAGVGEGPGEFERLSGVLTTSSEIWGVSSVDGLTHVFDLNGNLRRTHKAAALGVFPSGSFLIRGVDSAAPVPATPRTIVQRYFVLAMVRPSGDTLRVARLPGSTCVSYPLAYSTPGTPPGSSRGCAQQTYGPVGVFFVRGAQIYYSFTDTYEIAVLDTTGRTLRTISRAAAPVRVTESERREFITLYSMPRDYGGTAAFNNAVRVGTVQNMVFPEFHRALTGIHVDLENNLWVQQLPAYRAYNPRRDGQLANRTNELRPGRWDVFSPTGQFRGTVDMPAGLEVHEIGHDYVLGVWRDSLGVPQVRMHALRKG